jgi:hypothetical protein
VWLRSVSFQQYSFHQLSVHSAALIFGWGFTFHEVLLKGSDIHGVGGHVRSFICCLPVNMLEMS